MESIKILVVDDEEHIRIALKRILKRLDCEVYVAESGEVALDIMKNQTIDLVLLDLKMPGIDGMDVLKIIKQEYPETMVIVITGFATLEIAVESMKQGAYDFIPKPFDKEHILLVVGRAIENIRLKREKDRLDKEKQDALLDLITEKSRLKTILEALPNGVLVTNNKMEVVLINPTIRKHFNIPEDIELGKNISSYIQDPSIINFISTEMNEYEGDSKEFKISDDLYLLVKKNSILAKNHKFLGYVIISVDITPLKKLDQLKSEFVAKVSHELRGSLSTIHEQIAMVLQDLFEDPEFKADKRILEKAKQRTRVLTELIEKLLDLSRIESGKVYVDIKEIYIGEFLSSFFEDWKDQAQIKNQKITLELDVNGDFKIKADPRALKILFDNLVNNAIKYTPEKGEISIITKRMDNKGIVEVKDTGIGIDKEELDKIFNRFYRIRNEQTKEISGTGLGLSIVRGIVDDLGGKIEVSSTPGKGSTFRVILPLLKEEDKK